MKRPFLILLFFISGLVLAFGSDRKAAQQRMVRVAIVREAREINLEIEGQYIFRDGETGKQVGQGPRQPASTVRLLDRGIFIGMSVYPYKHLIIQPRRDASVIINNHHFRGDVMLIHTALNRLTVVNSINIEDYIKGVLYHEVSHHWPMEALKAQAVAARTYAMYSMSGGKGKDYDVTNDIYSQVYGGQSAERYRTGLAVDRTPGEVLVYNHQVLPAYFHATCAGMTEDANEIWELDLPPLRGVPCQFCQESPHMHWKKNFRLQDIQEKLNKSGHKIGLIEFISVVDRDRSGRINDLKIIARNGDALTVKGKDFRQLLGPNVIKSNNYEVQMQGYYVDFIGKGWGHGVGMCQWGSRGMALQGFNYKQILNYYYPGSALINYHDLPELLKSPLASHRLPDEQPQ